MIIKITSHEHATIDAILELLRVADEDGEIPGDGGFTVVLEND